MLRPSVLDPKASASHYAVDMIDKLLTPLVQAVAPLSPQAQGCTLTLGVTCLCKSWVAFILKERIKFRFVSCSFV